MWQAQLSHAVTLCNMVHQLLSATWRLKLTFNSFGQRSTRAVVFANQLETSQQRCPLLHNHTARVITAQAAKLVTVCSPLPKSCLGRRATPSRREPCRGCSCCHCRLDPSGASASRNTCNACKKCFNHCNYRCSTLTECIGGFQGESVRIGPCHWQLGV